MVASTLPGFYPHSDWAILGPAHIGVRLAPMVETPHGAKHIITADNKSALDALHDFLRFKSKTTNQRLPDGPLATKLGCPIFETVTK